MTPTLLDPTAEQLVEALAAAGEFDAGVEVFDALRMHDPTASSLVRLQARLFDAPDRCPREQRREALAPWRDGALERLAQRGALLETAPALRVMAAEYPDEPAWLELLGRIEAILAPLPNPHGDPTRTAIDRLVARGALHEAWEALRELARAEPHDEALAARVGAVRDLMFPPSETRSYDALLRDPARERPESPDVAALAARVQSAVAAGDLAQALTDAAALAAQSGSTPRWARFRDALGRLVAWSESIRTPASDEDVTTRTGPVERVDLWLRAGNLSMARGTLRQQLATADDDTRVELERRLSDLDVVLDGTLPTPIPVRPPAAAANVILSPDRAPSALEGTLDTPLVPAPMPAPAPAPATPHADDVQGTEDTEPARAPIAAPSTPAPPSLPSLPSPSSLAPPVHGDVRVGKRKIVRLS